MEQDNLPPFSVSKSNKWAPFKRDHQECYLLILKWEHKLSGNIFLMMIAGSSQSFWSVWEECWCTPKEINAQRNMVLIKTVSIVQEMGMLHGQRWATGSCTNF